MSPLLNRKLKYYLRLQYPVRIIAGDEGLVGSHPDLPGCTVLADTFPAVYAALEDARRAWIHNRILAGDEIPAPNAYLAAAEESEMPLPELKSYAQEATPF